VTFAELAVAHEPPLDRLALAIAAEFRKVDEAAALARLDELAAELVPGETPVEQGDALAALLGGRHGFRGERRGYDHPANSMLDLVLESRVGLPILLSTVWEEVARRRGIPLHGVGFPGHFVVAHFGADPPLLYDPFAGGARIEDVESELVRPWRPQETALRILNNLVASFGKHGDLGNAIRAAELRLLLPMEVDSYSELEADLRSYKARLN
jgi:regulator of sirC expression with transglutaminase-like and TPR domain